MKVRTLFLMIVLVAITIFVARNWSEFMTLTTLSLGGCRRSGAARISHLWTVGLSHGVVLTWIGHGSHICKGAQVVRSVLFEYTRIAPNVQLDDKIVFKDYSVDRSGAMLHISELEAKDWGNARDRRNVHRSSSELT